MFCSLAWYVCCLWNEQTVRGKPSVRSSEVGFLFTCCCLLKRCSMNCWLGVMVMVWSDFCVCKALELGNSKETRKVLLY